MYKSVSFKYYFLLFATLVGFFTSCNKDDDEVIPQPKDTYLIGVTAEKRISQATIISMIENVLPNMDIVSSPISFLIKDVDVVAITYRTTGVDGKQTEASGVIAIPANRTSYRDILSIQHGTLDMEQAPSVTLFNYEMLPAAIGRIVVMADYLGYGKSQTPNREHPYLHISSTGVACADMLEAAKEYLKSKELEEENDKIELMGYSQGGTSTIATLLELEKRGKASNIRAVHAGGGAYDLEGTLYAFTAMGRAQYPRTGYLPYIIRGMEYGEQLSLNPSKIYAPEVIKAGFVDNMFSKTALSKWHWQLGTDITKVINPDFYASPTFNGNTNIMKLMTAIHKNSLLNSNAPSQPVILYHSRNDDVVPFQNAEALHEKWENTTLVELTTSGHTKGAAEFILRVMGIWGFITQ